MIKPLTNDYSEKLHENKNSQITKTTQRKATVFTRYLLKQAGKVNVNGKSTNCELFSHLTRVFPAITNGSDTALYDTVTI
jgi:hypothetical protein